MQTVHPATAPRNIITMTCNNIAILRTIIGGCANKMLQLKLNFPLVNRLIKLTVIYI
jgi:hypothetical protein